MTLLRGQLLTTGPVALLALCYAISAPSSAPLTRSRDVRLPITVGASNAHLARECESAAARLEKSLPSGWGVVIREPFVLAGDVDRELLGQHYELTIAPTVRALSIQYFDHPPSWPVTLVLCSSDESYRECNRCLGERDRREYAGFYSRWEHRAVVNVATGDGTLAHELTHALAHADFPDMPQWLDEGLASLHEECEFTPDGLKLVGLENWRGAALASARERGEVRSVASLAGEPFASTERATVDYAQTRYFCLFLQRRQLLEPFYRKCRARVKVDPTGVVSLNELFASREPSHIDAGFLAWLDRLDADDSKNGRRR